MAVAVQHVPHLVLDEEYRIVEVGPPAEAGFGSLRGRWLWEAFPGSKSLFAPYYEMARRTGQPVEFVQFYDGHVGRVRAVPHGSRLHLYWEMLHTLNTLTLDGLRTSLDETIATLTEIETTSRRRALRASLSVVESGGRDKIDRDGVAPTEAAE